MFIIDISLYTHAYKDPSAKIGKGCRIGPNVIVGPDVVVEDGKPAQIIGYCLKCCFPDKVSVCP